MPGERLAPLSSPYLRLHATNPVEWFPWGDEAFARARAEDKPIFLSIGYYTCHWCHVMERESFADAGLADVLNRDFISIKVDREERPDVDRIYMAYVQATTGGGGWPLSVFLTPERKPFYGGTYFPPDDRFHLPSFRRVLASVAQAWREQRDKVLGSAAQASSFLSQSLRPARSPATDKTPPALLEASWPRLYEQLRSSFDAGAGGFGGAPKFPRPAACHFLLRYARRYRGTEAAAEATGMVLTTLRAMARGGIHDVLGGGFHRYATDAGWLVPHFEKMLYDQAQLAISYLEAWQMTREPDLAATARSTLDFVLRELRSPAGGFYSAQDADSPLPEAERRPGGPSQGEGAYYLWTWAEIETALGPAMASAFAAHYGLRPHGNVPAGQDPHGEFHGKNIPHGERSPELEDARAQLYALRRQRPQPPRDEKILAAWNALMISALALGARVLGEDRYREAAQAAALFFEKQRWTAASDTQPGQFDRTDEIHGFAEDYALFVQALLDLYQTDFDRHWLDWARALQQAQEARFADPAGGYFATGDDPHLYLRMREEYDGAEPSPNSVAASNLQRLALWFSVDGWREKADQLLASFADRLEHQPEALPLMVATLEAAAAPPRRLLITGADADPRTQDLLRVTRERFLPEYDVMRETNTSGSTAAPTAPAAYLCDDFTCQLPITGAAELAAALDGTQA